MSIRNSPSVRGPHQVPKIPCSEFPLLGRLLLLPDLPTPSFDRVAFAAASLEHGGRRSRAPGLPYSRLPSWPAAWPSWKSSRPTSRAQCAFFFVFFSGLERRGQNFFWDSLLNLPSVRRAPSSAKSFPFPFYCRYCKRPPHRRPRPTTFFQPPPPPKPTYYHTNPHPPPQHGHFSARVRRGSPGIPPLPPARLGRFPFPLANAPF